MCQDMLMKKDEIPFRNVSSSPEGLQRVSSSRAVLGIASLKTSHLSSAGRTTNTFAWNYIPLIFHIEVKSQKYKPFIYIALQATSLQKNTSYSPHNTPPAQARIHKETRSDSHCCIAKAMQWKATWVSCWILKNFNAAFSVPTGWNEFAQMG